MVEAAAAEQPVKINTRLNEQPDVDDDRGRLAQASRALVAELAAGRLTPEHYLAETRALHARTDLQSELRPWVERALAERSDQVLFRFTQDGRFQTLQLLYLDPREVHPPHHHHNLISTQVVLHGRVHVREYDRIARLDPGSLLLRLRTDRWAAPGHSIQASEVDRNAHWFAADDSPAVMLNFYVLGFQDWTFDPPERRAKGRCLLDPTWRSQGDGLIVARELDIEAGYAMFGRRAITEFPAIPAARA